MMGKKKTWVPPFTHLFLVGCACAATLAPWLQGICVCGLWGSAASFHAAPLVEPTVFRRMAEKNRWTMTQFHVGNLVVHVLPVVGAAGLARDGAGWRVDRRPACRLGPRGVPVHRQATLLPRCGLRAHAAVGTPLGPRVDGGGGGGAPCYGTVLILSHPHTTNTRFHTHTHTTPTTDRGHRAPVCGGRSNTGHPRSSHILRKMASFASSLSRPLSRAMPSSMCVSPRIWKQRYRTYE